MTQDNIGICREIVKFIRTRLVSLNCPYLVNYIYANFNEKERSSPL